MRLVKIMLNPDFSIIIQCHNLAIQTEMIDTTYDPVAASIDEASTDASLLSSSEVSSSDKMGDFLSEYAATLLSRGATCLRIKKNVNRIAEAWGLKVVMTIMPRHIHMAVTSHDGSAVNFIKEIPKASISFNIVTLLSKLSWDTYDRKMTYDQVMRAFAKVMSTPQANAHWVLLAASLANASFCRLFGGDLAAMVVVFFATFSGFYLKQKLTKKHVDVRLVIIVCAFVSGVIGASGQLFSLGSTPLVAVSTSVLYLVPGIPFLNSFSDMVDGHYLSFFYRMTDALVMTCCLSIGLCAAMLLMRVGMF